MFCLSWSSVLNQSAIKCYIIFRFVTRCDLYFRIFMLHHRQWQVWPMALPFALPCSTAHTSSCSINLFTLCVAEKFFFQHTIHEALRCCQRSPLHCKQKKKPSHFSVQLLLLNFLFAPKILWLVNRLLPNRGVPHKAWQGDLVHHIGWFQRILEGG